jgi:hypothetical protein
MNASEFPTKDWYAWHDFMPVSPPTLHVKGLVTCPTTGYTAHLKVHVPQGTNPAIYLLDLVVVPPAADVIVEETVTDVDVRYDEDTTESYTHVTILPEGVTVEVHITQ